MRIMKATITFTGALLVAALATSCSSTSPNTQRGAVGGAAAGALAGAVIGNNTGSHNGARGAVIGGALGGLAGAAVGNQADRRAENNATYQTADTRYTVQQPPMAPTSAPYENMTPQPSRDSVWVPGYYSYTGQGNQYEWVAGHWETPPSGSRSWVPPAWQNTGNGYVYVRGHWQ
jgi:hypothetical protein